MTQSFNTEPYWDDYDKHKHFYRILFRPGYSVQTRELTQMQRMIQEQVSRMGSHMFKEGTMVIPGELSLDNNFHYVKLQPTYANISVSTFIDDLVGVVIRGGTTGITAQVLAVEAATTTDPDTIYVKYLDKGTDGATSVFADNETISPVDVGLTGIDVQSIASSATGLGSAALVAEGVYYVEEHFVLCEPQTLILDKYTNTPTYHVGFNVIEGIVTPEQDESLLDNAQGTYNYAAPGAHRMSIELVLSKKTDLNDVEDTDDFILLVTLANGIAQNQYNQTQYAELAKVMARRTFDESGDYVVRDFKYKANEHRNNNRGAWATNTAYLKGDIVTHVQDTVTYTYEALTSATSGDGVGTWPTNPLSEFDDNSGGGGVTWVYSIVHNYNGGIYPPAPTGQGNEEYIALAVEPGKAYVKGYEVEKVATSFIPIPKARTSELEENGTVDTSIGNYVLVTRAHAIPVINDFPSVDLYSAMTTTAGQASANGAKIGTARIRSISFHSGTIGAATAVYKVSLFNIALNTGNDFSRDVKQLYISTGDVHTSFTADIGGEALTKLDGTISISTGTATGIGTQFTLLKVEDVISVEGKTYRVSNITNNSSMTLTSSPDTVTDTTNALFYHVTSKINEPQNSNLIFPVAPYIKTMRDGSNSNQVKYTVTKVFNGTTDGAGDIAFTLDGGNSHIFASVAGLGSYIGSYDDNTGNSGTFIGFTPGTGDNQAELSGGDKTATFHFGVALATTPVYVIATIEKSGTTDSEKTKTITRTTYEVTTAAEGTKRIITLPVADGIKVYSIKMKGGTYASPSGTYSIDITSRFSFDDGQTDAYYDRCKLILVDGQQAPIAPFEVTYAYYAHVGVGDYFSLNSYSDAYGDIPSFNGIPLGDCLDFRPRINNAGTGFSGTGSSVSNLPVRGNATTCEYQYYLGRIDKLCLEPSGDFYVVQGVPSLNPVAPPTTEMGMLLNTITLSPYTISPQDVKIETVDNRRYTMRDIGKLERRIGNLEYYTALSLAEQNVANMSIVDTDGLNRYKNGFIIDSFNGHGIGDSGSPDYMCSIDMEERTLRPYHTMKNITLFEADTANRVANNYVMTGDLVTLPYTHVTLIKQAAANITENVNPFAVFTWSGKLDVNPQSDDWIETNKLPDLVTNIEGNYNSIFNQTKSSGTLGTIWNAWQTLWTGVPQQTGESSTNSVTGGIQTTTSGTSRVATARGEGWRWTNVQWTRTDVSASILNTTTVRTFAQQTGQTRTGISTEVKEKFDIVKNGDRKLSTSVIPFMRARNVSFLAQGMKSKATLSATFDSIDVSSYITPGTYIKLNHINGFDDHVFDFTSNAGSSAGHSARIVGTNIDLALNKGFIIKGQTSNATAVVIYQEPIDTGLSYVNLYVANVKGTFQVAETVIGSMDGGTTGPRGTVAEAVTVKVKGDPLVSTVSGMACGILEIPNSQQVKFRTGTREFTLADSISAPTTAATATYTASGVQEDWRSEFTSTRNATVVVSNLNQNRTLTDTWSTTNSTSRTLTEAFSVGGAPANADQPLEDWSDPLAQTFMVDSIGGAFATKVDLYFSSKETVQETPVHIEIREVVNGIPAHKVAPFSKVYKYPREVNVSAQGTIATTFTFPSPVYLDNGKEYALVILSDSNNYNVFCSKLGAGPDTVSGTLISSQPYLGVLFKSSNGSTWTADQMMDLKFTLYRAQFNTAVTGTVNFSNAQVPKSLLEFNPIIVTNGSTIVRIKHVDHQMPNGSTVTISGVPSGNVGGVPHTELNGDHVIANVDHDSYTITVTTAGTSSAIGGGNDVYATENFQYDAIQVNTTELNFQNTSVDYSIKTTSGKSVDGSETPYVKDSSFTGIRSNANIEFTTPRMVASQINETTSLAGAKSLEVIATLKSTMDTISPVIDVQRFSAILVSNKINDPTLANMNVSAIDDRQILSVANKISFAASDSAIFTATTNTPEYEALLTLSPGKYINVTGSAAGSGANNGDHLVTGMEVTGGNIRIYVDSTLVDETASGGVTITIVQHQKFVDEICPMFGSAINKYISREIILAQPSTYLKAKLAVNVPPAASVDLYYRTNPIGATAPLVYSNWVKATPATPIPKSISGQYTDIDIDVADIASFDTCQFKITMRSTSSAQVPKCKELRVIACA